MFLDYAGSLLLLGFLVGAGGICLALACLVAAFVMWRRRRKTAVSLIAVVLLFASGATYSWIREPKRPSRELALSFQTELDTLAPLGFSCWTNSLFTTCLESEHRNQLRAKLPGGQVLEADDLDVFVKFLAGSTTPESITYRLSSGRPEQETIARLLQIRAVLASEGGLRDADNTRFSAQEVWIRKMAERTKRPVTYADVGPRSCQDGTDVEVCLEVLANADNTFTVRPAIRYRKAPRAAVAGPERLSAVLY